MNSPIIIIGTGRSGTTLVSETIFRHRSLAYPSNYHEHFPKINSIGLIRNLFDNRFYQIFGKKSQTINNEIPWWNKFLFIPSEAWNMWEYITGKETDFSRQYLLDYDLNPDQVNSIREYFKNLLFWQNKSRLGIKLTGPSRIRYLSSIFPNAIFLHVVRNPVPTISSFLNSPFWIKQGLNELWWKGAFSDFELDLAARNQADPVWMTAFQIHKILVNTREESKSVSDSYLEIKYEDFVNNPIDETKNLLMNLGLEIDDRCFNYILKTPVINSQKKDTDYFNQNDLKTIYSIFNSDVQNCL